MGKFNKNSVNEMILLHMRRQLSNSQVKLN